jgi:hypothetical protein
VLHADETLLTALMDRPTRAVISWSTGPLRSTPSAASDPGREERVRRHDAVTSLGSPDHGP